MLNLEVCSLWTASKEESPLHSVLLVPSEDELMAVAHDPSSFAENLTASCRKENEPIDEEEFR